MLRALAIIALAMLAGCGPDAPPVQPTGGVNVSVTPQGVRTGVGLGLRKGPFHIGVGL